MKKEEQVKRIIDREILTLANELISHLTQTDGEFYESWQNIYIEESDEYAEIFQYFIVTDWLAEKLKEIGEPVAELQGLSFWGRTCCGQAIEADGTIQKIVENLYKEGGTK